jgi:hypothetical protein
VRFTHFGFVVNLTLHTEHFLNAFFFLLDSRFSQRMWSLGLFFDPEDGSDMFFRNFAWLLGEYMAL